MRRPLPTPQPGRIGQCSKQLISRPRHAMTRNQLIHSRPGVPATASTQRQRCYIHQIKCIALRDLEAARHPDAHSLSMQHTGIWSAPWPSHLERPDNDAWCNSSRLIPAETSETAMPRGQRAYMPHTIVSRRGLASCSRLVVGRPSQSCPPSQRRASAQPAQVLSPVSLVGVWRKAAHCPSSSPTASWLASSGAGLGDRSSRPSLNGAWGHAIRAPSNIPLVPMRQHGSQDDNPVTRLLKMSAAPNFFFWLS
jgi:hypothetical protein